jgi:hypothetical protein
MPDLLPIRFRSDARFATLRDDLSAVHLAADGFLWLASDELQSLERLQWDGSQFGGHTSFQLGDFFDLPAGGEGEVDVEGLCRAWGYLWVVGSHSRKIKKPRSELSHKENIKRLRWKETQTEPNRYLLGRIPLADGELRKRVPDPKKGGGELSAAALAIGDGGNALVEALEDDPHIGRYVKAGLPGKANGFDVEGLEVVGDRLLLGLRGPVLLDWAILLEVEPRGKKQALGLKEVGRKKELYRKYFLNLHGLGVRDLCRLDDDLLILAGPTQYLDGPAKVFLLRGADQLDDKVMYHPRMLFEIPHGVGVDHPEGITLARGITGRPSILVIYDAPDENRRQEPNSVLADIFPLPI